MSIAARNHPAFAGLVIVAPQISINLGAAIAKGLSEKIGPEAAQQEGAQFRPLSG